jgi:hypothetical protein
MSTEKFLKNSKLKLQTIENHLKQESPQMSPVKSERMFMPLNAVYSKNDLLRHAGLATEKRIHI